MQRRAQESIIILLLARQFKTHNQHSRALSPCYGSGVYLEFIVEQFRGITTKSIDIEHISDINRYYLA